MILKIQSGITLIALIITIIVMLILVAVTVKTVIDSGLFGHASKATGGYSMHEVREQLGTTLAGAMAEKYINKDYDEDDYLTEYIKDNLPGSKVADNVVLVDGWAFEIDRTIPEIIKDLGKGIPEDFVAPELTVAKGDLAEDKLSIPINITVLESKNGISKIEVYKVGESAATETFPCSNETTKVNKTFTATENVKYKIVAYSKLRATKIIEITEIVPPSPQIGDIVRYTPDSVENYLMEGKYSGYSDQSLPQDTELKWKVMNYNDDGTIDLVADRGITTKVYFIGVLGYNNGVYLLNDLCKSHYSNASLGATGRSINLLDIEKHFNDTGKAARNAYTVNGTQYGNTKTYTNTNYTHTPHIYKKHYKNVTNASNNIAQVESENFYDTPTAETSSNESSLTIRQTYYHINSQVSCYNDPNFYNLIFNTGTTYWLASRYTSDYSKTAGFGLLYANSDFGNTSLFASNNTTYSDSSTNTVRPVVTLPSTLKLQLVSGSANEWEIVKK